MSAGETLRRIRECFVDLHGVDSLTELAKRALESGIAPLEIATAMKDALDEIGTKYDEGQYFLSDLIMSGIMATELMNILKPRLRVGNTRPQGRVVIGTVKGDIHDIGKSLTASMLSSQGFEVTDLGVDVAPEKFLESLNKREPNIIAMSCLLTIGMPEMQKTVELVKRSGQRVKVMIGGRPITQEFADEIGADAYGRDAFEAVRLARKLVGDMR